MFVLLILQTVFIYKLKGKDQLWSCDCIVKETLWNGSEKVDHLAYKYWCVLQGSGIIKMVRNLAQSWQIYKHCTQKDVYGTMRYLSRPDRYDNLPNISIIRGF